MSDWTRRRFFLASAIGAFSGKRAASFRRNSRTCGCAGAIGIRRGA